MSSGNYTHITRADGTVLTALIYNLDHQNHIINQNPLMTGGYQDSVPQKQVMSNPGPVGGEILATSLAGELEQIRFQLKAIIGDAQWYSVPPTTLVSLANPATATVLNKYPGLTPGGRLTLATNDPVFPAGGTGNILYYTPYEHAFVPIWDGTQFLVAEFGEVNQPSTDATKSPAATVANGVYDIFAWIDTPPTPPGGPAVNRISRGPPWTGDSTRSPGTDLVRKQGIWLNKAAITNGPAAERGTYLGTVKMTSGNQFCATFVAIVSTGSPIVWIWNAYNRIITPCKSQITTDWNPPALSDWSPAAGSGSFRIWFLRGLQIGGVNGDFLVGALLTTGTDSMLGFGLGADSTVTINMQGTTQKLVGTTVYWSARGVLQTASLGVHFIQAIEWNNIAGNRFLAGTNIMSDIEW